MYPCSCFLVELIRFDRNGFQLADLFNYPFGSGGVDLDVSGWPGERIQGLQCEALFGFYIKLCLSSGFDAARERLHEITPGESEGHHGRQHVENSECAEETVVNLLDPEKSPKQAERQHLQLR
jgi:hypothetical protein